MLSKLAEHAQSQLLGLYPDLEVRLVNRLPPSPAYCKPTIAL